MIELEQESEQSMSKSKSKRIIISSILCLIGIIITFGVHHDINERKELAGYQAQMSQAKEKQIFAFFDGYEQTMGPIETKDEAVKVGKAAQILCVYLDNDPDLKGAFLYGTDKLELSSDQAVAVIDTGIHVFCPRHTPLLQAGE